VPGAVYHDRAGVFEPALRQPLTLEEQLFDTRVPTQLGRAFAELGIGSIAARSPQAKGRIERLWGTLQDRLIPELRLAGIEDRDGANAFLGRYLARHNRRFAISPAEPEPAWRRMAGGTPIERACCFKYRRTVARDGTVRAGATILQVPAQPNGRSRAGQRVELHVRLDGRLVGVLEAEAADSATIVDAVVAAAVSGERPDWNRLGVEQAERVAPASDGGSMGLLGDVLDLMARAGRGLGAVTESQVIEVPSKSHPGEVNIVRISAGVATCTCKGFEYRGDCSHDRQAAKDAAAWPKHRFT